MRCTALFCLIKGFYLYCFEKKTKEPAFYRCSADNLTPKGDIAHAYCRIIAEYNPFHSGHEYHLKEAKKKSGADYAVIVMSPDFVQRGTPAVFDKYMRTEMALRAGADLVLELPVCYAWRKRGIFCGRRGSTA